VVVRQLAHGLQAGSAVPAKLAYNTHWRPLRRREARSVPCLQGEGAVRWVRRLGSWPEPRSAPGQGAILGKNRPTLRRYCSYSSPNRASNCSSSALAADRIPITTHSASSRGQNVVSVSPRPSSMRT
jgi:hypothetical protein